MKFGTSKERSAAPPCPAPQGRLRGSRGPYRGLLSRLRRLNNDSSGEIVVEYVVIVGCAAIAMAVSLAAVGPKVVRAYEKTRNTLYSPFP